MTTNTADAATLALTALLLLPLGLAVGSFLNVVIWRVPQGMSVVRPPSACPRCGHAIRERDNVPVVSWLLLRGRCRDCQEPISVRYPLVEAATGVLFVATGLFTGPSWVLPGLLYLVSISIALALIDIDTRRLPDVIVLPSYLVALALLTLASWNPGGEADWGALVRALIGGAAMFALYLVLVLVYPAGMGRGDLKLSGVLGCTSAGSAGPRSPSDGSRRTSSEACSRSACCSSVEPDASPRSRSGRGCCSGRSSASRWARPSESGT